MKTNSAGRVALLMMTLYFTVVAARADKETEPASSSRLVGIRLPAGAQRVTDAASAAEVNGPLGQLLGQLAKDMKPPIQLVAPEVLAWEKKQANPAQIMAAVASTLKQAGYSYKTLDFPVQGGSSMKMVVSGVSGKGIAGLWITTGDIVALAWGRIGPQVAAGGSTLVEGTPPLTLGMVNRHAEMMSWVLRLSDLSDEQRQILQVLSGALMGDAWQRNDADRMVAYLGTLADHNRRSRMAPAEAEWKRQYWMSEWRKAAKRPGAGEEMQALRRLVEARDVVVATGGSGGSPLTAAARDAYVEMAAFAMSQMANGPGQINATEKKHLAAWLTAEYPRLSATEQNAFSEMPLLWTALRAAWPQQKGAARADLMQKWQQMFGPFAQAFSKQRAANKSYAALLEAAGTVRTKVSKGTIKPADYERLASLQESTARVLRNTGGAASLKLANELVGYSKKERANAKSLRSARTPTAAKGTTGVQGSSSNAYASMSLLNAHVSMSNFMTRMHVSRMNTLANWGNSPYRYEVRY